MTWKIPGAENRTAIMGATGTGKTVLGASLLSMQRLDKRPWVLMDFKDEVLWKKTGEPPIQSMSYKDIPKKPGLYRLECLPGDEDNIEEFMWNVWKKENIGIFCDEVSLLPKGSSFKALLRQGRSKRIPIIACSQRPVGCDREVFTESENVIVFRLDDKRDYDVVKGFTRNAPIEGLRPKFHSWLYDKPEAKLYPLPPGPAPDKVAKLLRERAPQPKSFMGFFLR